MTEDEAFIASIVNAPDDPALRLVYADWLEERGDPRAEFLRLTVSGQRPQRLRAVARRMDRLWLAAMNMSLKAGDEVEVIGGMWQGFRATVEGVDLLREAVLLHLHAFMRPTAESPAAHLGEVVRVTTWTTLRKGLEDTWRLLESEGDEPPRWGDGIPFVPPRMPSQGDEEQGFSFFRTRLEDADYSNLTLPRTFFGGSFLLRVSFSNTELSESRLCWNDFEECDFSGADLSGCDLRASNFKSCNFAECVLRDADLRQASFTACDFTDANVTGARVDRKRWFARGVQDTFDDQQRAVVTPMDAGPEPPPGG